jgi:hypothetical protein
MIKTKFIEIEERMDELATGVWRLTTEELKQMKLCLKEIS